MWFEHGTQLTYASFDRDRDRLARNLATLGIIPGDRAMVVLENRVEFMLVMIAVQKLGVICVPINTELKGAFLQYQLRNSEPRVLFLDHELSDAFNNVDGENDNLTMTIYVAGDVPNELPAVFVDIDAMTFDTWRVRLGDVLVTPWREDIACIRCTSGTTGPARVY